jgi:hypothetical protein
MDHSQRRSSTKIFLWAIVGKELDSVLPAIHVFDASSSLIDRGAAYLLNLLIVGYQ